VPRPDDWLPHPALHTVPVPGHLAGCAVVGRHGADNGGDRDDHEEDDKRPVTLADLHDHLVGTRAGWL